MAQGKRRSIGRNPVGMGLGACSRRDGARKRRWISLNSQEVVYETAAGKWSTIRPEQYKQAGLVNTFADAVKWAIATALA